MAVKTERFIGLGQTLLHCKALTIIFKIGYGKTISHDSQISPNCEFFPSWAHCAVLHSFFELNNGFDVPRQLKGLPVHSDAQKSSNPYTFL